MWPRPLHCRWQRSAQNHSWPVCWVAGEQAGCWSALPTDKRRQVVAAAELNAAEVEAEMTAVAGRPRFGTVLAGVTAISRAVPRTH